MKVIILIKINWMKRVKVDGDIVRLDVSDPDGDY